MDAAHVDHVKFLQNYLLSSFFDFLNPDLNVLRLGFAEINSNFFFSIVDLPNNLVRFRSNLVGGDKSITSFLEGELVAHLDAGLFSDLYGLQHLKAVLTGRKGDLKAIRVLIRLT